MDVNIITLSRKKSGEEDLKPKDYLSNFAFKE